MDERGRSLVMDDTVGVSAPAWWNRMAVDGMVDGGGWGGDVVASTDSSMIELLCLSPRGPWLVI